MGTFEPFGVTASAPLTNPSPLADPPPVIDPDACTVPQALELKDCCQSFKDAQGHTLEVVKNISFKVEGNQTVALLGPSGCGKSTILKMVSGLYGVGGEHMPTTGMVYLNGELTEGPRDEVLTIFQTPILCPWLNVLGNTQLSFKPSLWAPRRRYPWEVGQDIVAHFFDRFEKTRLKIPCSSPMKEVEQRSLEILEAVGLSDSWHKFPHELSGGMKQRASLATGLVIRPQVLCMDEPFSALDEAIKIEMRALLKKLRKQYPCLILLVTHDVSEALDLADRVIVLSTKPATILKDIPLPEERSDEWAKDTKAQILQLLQDAPGHGTIRVGV